jgi:hypothetical protein
MKGRTLVIFDEGLPRKGEAWWHGFDALIGPSSLAEAAKAHGLAFLHIESFIEPGNIEEAARLTRELSLIKTAQGDRVAKAFQYKGYELWWIHYDDFMYKFCLPYTQYAKLLERLKGASAIYLYKPPFPDLFRCFLSAHRIPYEIEEKFERQLPFGIILQTFLSLPFLLWAKLRRPNVMIWASDLFDPPRDHDFRLRFIHEEMRAKQVRFIEFIRSMEPTQTMLGHAAKRQRPVIYSFAIVKFLSYFASFRERDYEKAFTASLMPKNEDALARFWYLVSIHYIENVSGDIAGIEALAFALRFLGVRASIIASASSRSFHEVLASKLNGIGTIGILHGAASPNYNVYDFMPEFDGGKRLSLDKYGMWSEWWKAYYITHSKAYKPEQLFVSGPMRPLEGKETSVPTDRPNGTGPVKVLLVPGQLSEPGEVMPYILKLMESPDVSLYLTFRPYRDEFETWMRQNEPAVLERLGEDNILLGDIKDAIAQCDVVVGSYSTAVLEALLQLKPFVFFRTKKWGDYFSLAARPSEHPLFASKPEELVEAVKQSREVSLETIKGLQKDFFGDPYQNGSKWVVDEARKALG